MLEAASIGLKRFLPRVYPWRSTDLNPSYQASGRVAAIRGESPHRPPACGQDATERGSTSFDETLWSPAGA
eukprot:663904-Alexandrium_andersonii.AAC.1